ncbi:MAG: SCO family protein [Gammaproteobacteria bacterium]|nr:SCO family protein [Gammaproteobacteria bacterium]
MTLNLRRLLAGMAALLMVGVLLLVFSPREPAVVGEGIPTALQGVMRPVARPISDFELVDQSGRPFDSGRLAGHWSLVFFGYTYCPDICPTTLATLTTVLDGLEQESSGGGAVRVLFVSVDPARDTPEVLTRYLAYFGRNLSGLTGSRQQIDEFAQQFGAGYVIESPHAPGEYLVSHASSIFLVDPNSKLIASFSPPHSPATLIAQIDAIRALYQ